MALTPGTRFGSYALAESIGAGGMGEVYRAHDLTLGRDVAIKVLPDSFADDAGRVVRFEQEAKTLAALNHPNIAHIYGLERSEGNTAIVMELVEGATLADRIEHGPLPVDEALSIATQIAAALEAAHARGIVHRDLKPANVKVRPDGTVKVLDFGIAKALTPELEIGSGASPVMTTPATQLGVILGTAAYMSPEQARGKAVDQRADIWAYGCVLYEMITGQPAFGGEDVAIVLARVLERSADLHTLPAAVSAAVKQTIGLCLQKDPNKRIADIRDVRLALHGAFETETAPPSASISAARSPVPWAIAAGTIVLAAAVAFVHFSEPPAASAAPIRFAVSFPQGLSYPSGFFERMGALSVSPDGRFIAFAPAGEDGNTSLWVRALDSEFAQELDRTSGASFPFWSPDSREIGFFSGGQLRRIPVSGGAPVTVAPAPLPVGGTWNQAGQIVFASAATGLNVVSASGGTPSPATTTEAFGVAPVFLPDGSHFVYGGTDAAGAGSFIQELGSGEPKLISRDPFGDFAAPNHLILVRNGTALAQDLDMATFEPEGEPFVLASDVAGFPGTRAAISVSGNGVAVIGTDRAFAGQALRVYQRDGGTREELLAADAGALSVALSPDGRRLAVVRSASDSADITDLWLLDLESGVYSRLTSDSSTETDPTWSSDSTRVLYALRADDKNELRELTVGASAEKVIFANSDGWAVDDWTRDGQWIVFRSVDRRMHLLRYGEQQAEVVSEVTTAIDQTHVAPNGRWVAFNSTESGRTEVYVAAFPSFREKRQISVGGGAQPQWRADGRELYYLAPDSTLMAVEIESDVTLETGNRSALFRTDIIFNGDLDNFVPSPDGQSFYVVEPENEAQLEPRVIVNWPALRN